MSGVATVPGFRPPDTVTARPRESGQGRLRRRPLQHAADHQHPHQPLPVLTLTRGARHLAFVAGGRTLAVLRGEMAHKNLWLIDLATGTERQVTNFGPDFVVRDFDISPDGREIVVEQVHEQSDVVLIERQRR